LTIAQIAANADKLGSDPSKEFVGSGASAGGNIRVVIGLLARDEKLSPSLTGLCLLTPSLMDWRAIPEECKSEAMSYEQNKDGPVFSMKVPEILIGTTTPISTLLCTCSRRHRTTRTCRQHTCR
jgi:hypothetical protein